MRASERAVTRAGLALLLVGLGSTGALAQEPDFESVQVSLWPEYDRPEMLVIYRAVLPESFELPGTVRMRIPVGAGQPNAVAERDATGNLVVAGYERSVNGVWAVLTIRVRESELQVEFYDPIDRDGRQRQYRYVWPGEHDVAALEVQVQEPVDTVEMRIVPPSPGAFPGPAGLALHTLDLGAVPAGEERVVTLDWVRDTDALSATPPAVAAAPAPSQNPPDDGSGASEPSIWYRLLFALAAAAVAGIIVYGSLFVRAGADDGQRRFCSGCGGRIQPEDRFCAACGRELG